MYISQVNIFLDEMGHAYVLLDENGLEKQEMKTWGTYYNLAIPWVELQLKG